MRSEVYTMIFSFITTSRFEKSYDTLIVNAEKWRKSNRENEKERKALLRSNTISIEYKIRQLRAQAFSIYLYSCETGTLAAELKRKVQTLEMRSHRTILGISQLGHIANDQVQSKFNSTLPTYPNPTTGDLTTVKKRKLNWYGYVTRSGGLTKQFFKEP